MKKTITTLLMLCLYFYGCGTNDIQQEDGMATWNLVDHPVSFDTSILVLSIILLISAFVDFVQLIPLASFSL